MQKVLIVEDNIIQSKQIINYIFKHNEDIRLYHIAYTYNEAINIIKKQAVDIILLDLKLPDISGTEIIKFIQENNITKYMNSILIISAERELFFKISNSPYIFSYIPKPCKLEEIQKNVDLLVQAKTDNYILNKINNELTSLHYNFSYNGTRYLAETIFELYKQQKEFKDNLERDIYPIIARRHNKTVNTIHGNIKHATKYMYLDCQESIINQYFNYTYYTKPKLKEIIFTILNKIQNN